ncbi:LA_1841 family salt-regulated protein [Leptospira borgpetersenii]|uniref:Uncharacterized protein n=3 Tax=Leptospira borgpetersenii TaxID=174 RepID=Q04UB1_LEPBJ|nr:hypothetical protein [Leptospira borgpetersenii]ABJ75509.1 Hypothetical protein LBJ_0856 [Leptospira borgpetersenii serovar Hardjo-bovis str. JB197]ABJ78437.1 Hypothetical protein LBL_0892 [Leptospira borgpetersenii serovar Hardjo-bovis str. L550]AMX57675.1 hypothetical protein LBK6_04685 [Leptospira borgpetersenii serovar Hardjo]AMX60908.1 hypothetical protein LBK9_04620 [Leptospira borgpetersenii serovar Hardjo]AMX64151.1 hypothetical protein LBK30_04655 [Leptospira borgpetersenii serovar
MTAYYLKLGKISIIICFVVFGFTNCAMGSVTITGKNFPPLAETEPIDVILRAVPDYQVEQIGIVEVRCGQLNHCIEYVKEKAREQGADVIILADSGIVTSVQYMPGTRAGNTSTPGQISSSNGQIQTWEIARKILTPSKEK